MEEKEEGVRRKQSYRRGGNPNAGGRPSVVLHRMGGEIRVKKKKGRHVRRKPREEGVRAGCHQRGGVRRCGSTLLGGKGGACRVSN